MTKVLKNAYIILGGSEVSSGGNQVSINYEADSLENTAFGDDTHKFEGGLKVWSMDMTFHQSFADNGLDEILFALVGTTVTVGVRPENTAKGASNPEYSGTGLIKSYTPIGNAVGELAAASITIEAAGTLSRLTA